VLQIHEQGLVKVPEAAGVRQTLTAALAYLAGARAS